MKSDSSYSLPSPHWLEQNKEIAAIFQGTADGFRSRWKEWHTVIVYWMLTSQSQLSLYQRLGEIREQFTSTLLNLTQFIYPVILLPSVSGKMNCSYQLRAEEKCRFQVQWKSYLFQGTTEMKRRSQLCQGMGLRARGGGGRERGAEDDFFFFFLRVWITGQS